MKCPGAQARKAAPAGDTGVAVVTGAASGIGLATAALYLASGWTVLALDHDASALSALRLQTEG